MSHYSKSQIEKLLKSKNHYQTLGLSSSATQKQIKQAFKQKALKYHPDKNSIPQAKQLFGKVASAYEKLSDSKQKAKYDASFSRQRTNQFSANSFKKEETSYQKPKSYQKEQYKKTNFTSFRKQNKQKYDKYFKPPPKPHIPKPSHSYQKQEDTTFNQQQQKKFRYRARTIKGNTSYGTVLLTLLCFILFWSFVPNFSTQPRYQFARVGPFNYKMKTARYKINYWIKAEDVNKTQISESKLQQNYINQLEKSCQTNINMKQRVEQMKKTDLLNNKFWMQKQKIIDYKACNKLLKLIKRFPEIKLNRLFV